MDRATFQRLALERLRATYPDITFSLDADEGRISATRDGVGTQLIVLENHWREFEAAPPGERERLLARFARSMVAVDSEETLDEIRVLLVPRIRPRRYFTHDVPAEAEAWASMQQHVVDPDRPREPYHTAFAEHLGVALAIDRPERIEYVMDPRRYPAPPEELDAMALANLKRMTTRPLTPLRPGLYEGNWGDDYAAERMLLPIVWEKLALRGDPVVFLPGAEAVLVTGSDDREGLAFAAGLADERLAQPRPLMDIPFVRRDGAWAPFLPPGPMGAAFALRLALGLADVYADQKERLVARFADEEDAPFVASVMGFGTDEGEPRVTMTAAAWSRGVRTWLPRVVNVAFTDTETGAVTMAPWEDVLAVAGALLRPVDEPGLYPPRWETRGFPDDAMMAELARRAATRGVPSTGDDRDDDAEEAKKRATRRALAAQARPVPLPEEGGMNRWVVAAAIGVVLLLVRWLLRR